mmetsp:Transcript_39971/g.93553  ORF Transcript_39971/g.93553 Transcript_39971/m.93553 type:complete len:216 (-) Transcript_39971:88-735(-)
MQLHGCIDRDEWMVGQIVQRPDKLIRAFLAETGSNFRLCPHAPQGIPIQPLKHITALQEVRQPRGCQRFFNQLAEPSLLEELLQLAQLPPKFRNELLCLLHLLLQFLHGLLRPFPLALGLRLRLTDLLLELISKSPKFSFEVALWLDRRRLNRLGIFRLLGPARQNNRLSCIDPCGAQGRLVASAWWCRQRQLLDGLGHPLHFVATSYEVLAHLC